MTLFKRSKQPAISGSVNGELWRSGAVLEQGFTHGQTLAAVKNSGEKHR
jgi:hypothetical protein